VEHGGDERGERAHGKPDRDQAGGQALDDQKDHDQTDPDGRHGEGDPGDDHRQNLLLQWAMVCLCGNRLPQKYHT